MFTITGSTDINTVIIKSVRGNSEFNTFKLHTSKFVCIAKIIISVIGQSVVMANNQQNKPAYDVYIRYYVFVHSFDSVSVT